MLELNKIYNMECLEGLKQIDDESIDLVLTDPPYNENYNYRGSGFKDYREDYYQFLKEVLVECNRVLKPTGSIYIKHSSRQIQTVLPLASEIFKFRNLIIWISNSQAHPNMNYDSYYEPIYFLTKGDDYIFNKRAEYRKEPPNYWSGEGKEFVGLLTNCFYDIKKVQAGVLAHVEGGKKGNEKPHPCSMPIKLAERLIKVSTDRGGCARPIYRLRNNRNSSQAAKKELHRIRDQRSIRGNSKQAAAAKTDIRFLRTEESISRLKS